MQSATILSMVTGSAIGRSRLPGTEHAALYASSCECNVTICSVLGYVGVDGRNGASPAFASHRVDRVARGAGLAARGPREPQPAAQCLTVPPHDHSGAHLPDPGAGPWNRHPVDDRDHPAGRGPDTRSPRAHGPRGRRQTPLLVTNPSF